jgi:hypothetical protein
MKPAHLAVALLFCTAVLHAGEDRPPATWGVGSHEPGTEVTIDRKDVFAGGVSFGGPLGLHATMALWHGMGADVREEKDRVKAVCAAPSRYCARGFVLEVGAGSGGGKMSLGLGARARVENEDFRGVAAAALKLSVARTWGSPIGARPDTTYLGPEMSVGVAKIGINLGLLWRVSGRGGPVAVFSWGLGLAL